MRRTASRSSSSICSPIRTSTATLRANQLPLWLSSMTYVLVAQRQRGALQGTALAHAQVGTIRLRLLTIGALVRISALGATRSRS
jgi:hypothetical protein